MERLIPESNHSVLERYLPRRVAEWDLDAAGKSWQRIDGALAFVDISGFTALTERLAQKGRIGAEELTDVLSHVFGSMLDLARERGGSLVKFGGDALLLMFEGDDAGSQAVSATIEMRASLSDASKITTSVGRIRLRMSVGVHAGPIELYRVGELHDEMVIVGPTAAKTVELEGIADAGEILLSRELAARLPADATGPGNGPGVPLRWRRPRATAPGPVPRRPVDVHAAARAIPRSLRDRLLERAFESEHRVATVGFIKFSGVGDVLTSSGPGELAAQLDELMCLVQREADAQGLTFLNADTDVDGGKVTLIAGVPVHQEDGEGRLLRAVRRIIDADTSLPVSAGISRGALFSAHIGTDRRAVYTVMGDAINLAARLASAAPYGSIFISPEVAERSRTVFDLTELEPIRVKGKTAPVRVMALGAERGQRTDPEDADLPFVGRETELEILESALADLGRGTGGGIAITGDAGSGKTRLLRAALHDSPADRMLVFRAEAFSQESPYWVFRDPLRRLLRIQRGAQDEMAAALRRAIDARAPHLAPIAPLIGDLIHVPIPDTEHTATIEARFRPAQIAAAFTDVLDALTTAPVVVVVEDRHWMDEASRLVIEHLTQIAHTRQWLVLMTSRDTDSDEPGIDATIVLEPLSEDEARRLVIAGTETMPLLPQDLDSVIASGAGNPLFLTELIRRLRTSREAKDLPESLEALVGSSIDRLDSVPRQVLQYASVLGRSFRRIVLTELLELDGLEIGPVQAEALEAYLESEDDDRIRFRNAVIRDVAYAGLSYRRRRMLHSRAAEVIGRLAGDDKDSVAEFLAIHGALAGDSEAAWKYSIIAGDKARDAFSNVEAATQYQRALDASAKLDDVPTEALVDVWTSLARVLEESGMLDVARAAIGSALRLVRTDPIARADLYLRRARMWMTSGSFANAKRNITLGRKGLASRRSPSQRGAAARLDSLAAAIAMYEGRPREALRTAEDAAESARAAGDDDALARSFVVLDWAHQLLGEPELATHGEEALELLEGLGHLKRASDVMNNEGGYAYFAGRWDDAVSWYRRSQDTSQRAGNVIDAAFVRANIAEVLIGQGRLEEAAMELHESHRVLRATGALPYLGFVELQLARLEIESGDARSAVGKLESMYASLGAAGDRVASLEVAVHLADALIRSGNPQVGLEILDATEGATGEPSSLFAAARSRVRSQGLWAIGQHERAEAEASTGLRTAHEAGMPYEEALLLSWIASMDAATGRSPDPAAVRHRTELEQLLGIQRQEPEHDPVNRP